MAVQLECPICGSYSWQVFGYENPVMITGIWCMDCGYEENYVEPKDRNPCPCCEVPKKSYIGDEPLWNLRFEEKRICKNCGSEINVEWRPVEEVAVVRCSKYCRESRKVISKDKRKKFWLCSQCGKPNLTSIDVCPICKTDKLGRINQKVK